MRRAFRWRLRIIAGSIVLLALLLVLRLYFVQIVHAQEYSLRAERQYVSSSQQLYDRGSILFTRKDGTYLSAATVADGFLIAIDPQEMKDPNAAYQAILAVLPMTDHDTFFADAAKTSSPYVVIGHHVSDTDGRALDAKNIPGIIVSRERWRVYPAGSEAAQTIGFTGYADDGVTILGRYGLERYYDAVLQEPGNGVFGNFFAELFANLDNVVVDASAAREGDVITSIEPIVQEKLDQDLKQVNDEYSSQMTGGIIMDPSTGEIIAMDTYPEFDPNNFQSGNINNFDNPLVSSRYEFGSIFKVLTMTSGLDAGVIQPDTTYNDTGCIEVDKSKICNYDLRARGVIPMQQILSQSLNVGASFIATQLGHDEFRKYFTNLGLGEKTGIDLPSEIPGDIRNLNSPRDVEYDTAAFGQGIATTPVETIRALASVANHGAIVTPHVATAIRLQSGVVKTIPWPAPVQVFKPQSVDEVDHMLTFVVDNNLANGADKIPSMTVGAKTGTAQIAGPDGKYIPGNVFFHSFFGFFPVSNPRYVILLYTVKPQGVEYASETLTATFIDMTHFLINYYDIPPDRATLTSQAMKSFLRNVFASILAILARGIVQKYQPKIVMITGSVGKTSTKDAVAAALSEGFQVRKSEKSYNSEFGVPLTIIGAANPWANPGAWLKLFGEALALRFLPNIYPNMLVLEVGADRPGDLEKILKIALPDAVVVTRLPEVPVHVEAYATPAAVREEEFYPAYALDTGMPLILNAEDTFANAMSARLSARVVTFGTSATASAHITDSKLHIENGKVLGMQATLRIETEECPLQVAGVVGNPALYAPAAAIATATALGMSLKDACKGLEAYMPPPGRARVLQGINGSVLIDDSYNSSPAATEEALASLALISQSLNLRRIAVLGDMLELGRYSHEEHEKIGTLVAKQADVLIAVGIRSRSTADAAKAAGMPEENVFMFSNSEEAILGIKSLITDKDVVLIKGSQGVRTERIVEALLQNPEDRALLVRQDTEWKKR